MSENQINYNPVKIARQNAIIDELKDANVLVLSLSNEKATLLEENAKLKQEIDKLVAVKASV